jgi:molybdopterin synthase sulfur carrier subunit
MPIEVRYFASLREQMGRAGDSVHTENPLTIAEIWTRVADGRALPPNTLVAINMEYAKLDGTAHEGDEVAFFPPVTGG